jgi:hypothetical protein
MLNLFDVFPFMPSTFVVGSLVLVTSSYAYALILQGADEKESTTKKELPLLKESDYKRQEQNFHFLGLSDGQKLAFDAAKFPASGHTRFLRVKVL